jgi:hypothetical protein
MDENRGFIAADKGNILTTTNGGHTWSVETWEGQPNFSKIAFRKDRGVITGGRGIILQTFDGGKNWRSLRITAAKQKNRYVNLNGAFFVNDNQIWLLGSEGVLLFSDDNGRSWIPKKFKGYNYHSSFTFSSNELMIGGTGGVLIRTKNGGASWTAEHLPMEGINVICSLDDRQLTIGDSGTILESNDKGETWQVIKKGKNFSYTIINFLAPFAFIWLLFLPAYITLPNIKVPFKAAGLGAAFTGAVWVIFILLFIVYIKQFAYSTFAVYGTLAGIPLFLLMVYASSLIILLGAEVAYTIMYPETYRNLSNAFKEKKELLVYNGISLLQYIYEKFEKGGGSTSQKELQKAIAANQEEISVYIQLFLNEKLIQLNAESGYAPANISGNVSINDIIDLVMRISFELPAISEKSSYRHLVSKIFHDISENRKKVVGNLTLRDLIENK